MFYLRLGNLPQEVTEEEVRELLVKYGAKEPEKVFFGEAEADVEVDTKVDTKGGYAAFSEREHADKLAERLNGMYWKGKAVVANVAVMFRE